MNDETAFAWIFGGAFVIAYLFGLTVGFASVLPLTLIVSLLKKA